MALVFVIIVGFICSLLLSGCASSKESLEAKYFMSFHACDTALKECTPQEHETYVAQSEDGVDWEILPNWQASHGSVPDVVQREDKFYIFSTTQQGGVSVYDLKTQEASEPEHVSVDGLPNGFVDPAPILKPDGDLSLFFIFCRDSGGTIKNCFPPQDGQEFFVGSADEVSGSEGTEFTMREDFQLSVNGGTDPDVFYDGRQYVLYISHGPSFKVYTSKDLHGDYQPVSESNLSQGTGGVPSGYYNADNKEYWSYSHYTPAGGASVIRKAEHQDLTTPLKESDWQTVFTSEDLGFSKTTLLESPGFIGF